MEVKPDRMVYLGYGKYWRSDAIIGLAPIEEDRGPGRRTEVYTATLSEPLIASRSERAILRDMAVASDDALRMEEVRQVLIDLTDALSDLPDVLSRLLANEGKFDADRWTRRLRQLLKSDYLEHDEDQSDLFD